MKKLLFLIFSYTILVAGQALSMPLIEVTLEPSTDKIHPPENLFIDINISGLGSGGVDNLLRAWDLDVFYDSTLFNFLAVPPAGFGDKLGNATGGSIADIDATIPGKVSLFEVSLLVDFELDALQRDDMGNLRNSFTLATIGLFAPAGTSFSGSSTLIEIDNIVLSDAFGNAPSDINGDPIPVQDPQLSALSIKVPEPTTFILFCAGLVGLLSMRRHV